MHDQGTVIITYAYFCAYLASSRMCAWSAHKVTVADKDINTVHYGL